MKAGSKGQSLSYRNRLGVLVLAAIVLTGLFWKQKLAATMALWKTAHSLAVQQRQGGDRELELVQLQRELAAFQQGTVPASQLWQKILDRISQGPVQGVRLFAVDAEHQVEYEGLTINTLPLTLEGKTKPLLELVDRLEHEVHGVHVFSLDLHTTTVAPTRPRQLLATAYFQTIAP